MYIYASFSRVRKFSIINEFFFLSTHKKMKNKNAPHDKEGPGTGRFLFPTPCLEAPRVLRAERGHSITRPAHNTTALTFAVDIDDVHTLFFGGVRERGAN